MPTRPTGTVTFLFSDIEGSTKRWEHQRELMTPAFARQEAMMRQAIADNNGYAYKMIGDAFQAAFASAADAINAAIAAQRALFAEKWGEIGEIRVRMGLHTGVTEERSDDYVGPELNRVARLMSVGYGGQVLLSQTTRDLIYQDLPQGVTLRDLGVHLLKDIRAPQQIYQLVIEKIPSEFPPLKTLAAYEEPPRPGEPPFKGLQYFDEPDADLFFGRKQMTAKLVDYVHSHRFLAIIGASGSGKSSIVRAGLVPALRHETPPWQIHIITPTAHPLESLATTLTREAESVTAATTLADDLARETRSLRVYLHKRGSRHLLIVDQFEELFTLCHNDDERHAFVDNLLNAVEAEGSATTVAITLRADFYEHLAQFAALREAVSKNQEYIGPMSADELRLAIEEPAKRGKWEFAPGVVDLLLHDVGTEPGALPLLSHALLETWKRRRGSTMTLKGYSEAGGVRGAIARTAESVYNDELTQEQQTIARSIFLRLTELGEGTQDTRRRVARSELIPPAPTSEATLVETVLVKLADARLITTSEGTVEVAHEALIREWSRLREWLAQNREGLRLHRHLTEAAQEWERLGRDPGSLYRGTRLGQALEWAETKPIDMNLQEWSFLEASQKQAEHEEVEREAQRQRELEAARKLAETERRAASRLRQRAVFLAGTLLVAAVLAIAAIWFAQQSNQNARVAENERLVATARELSAAALANLDIDPELGILLASRAVSLTYSLDQTVLPEAQDALHRAVQASRTELVLIGHTDQVYGVAYNPDGTRIASASYDKTAKVWDAISGKELLTLTGHSDKLENVVFSLDGARIATASDDKTAKTWDAKTGKELVTFVGHSQVVRTVAFSPDGKFLATASDDATAKIWDAASGRLLLTISGHAAPVRAVAFSPDDTRLVTSSADKMVKVWDVATALSSGATTAKELLTIPNLTSPTPIFDVKFSPDGKRLVTAFYAFGRTWDATTGKQLQEFSFHTGYVWRIAMSPDGARVATAGQDGKAKVWDSVTGHEQIILLARAGIFDVVFSPDGERLAAASSDGTVRVWSVGPIKEWLTIPSTEQSTPPSPEGMVNFVNYNPDGTRLVAATGSVARIYDTRTGKELRALSGHTGIIRTAVFSPNGTRVATGSRDKTAKIWDVATGKELLTLTWQGKPVGTVDALAQITLAGISDIAFSPDGKRIATVALDGVARIWDAATGQELLTIQADTNGYTAAIAFSPDGSLMATGGLENNVKLWDASTGKLQQTLPGHTSSINRVVFSPDGKRIAASSADKTVKVWDVQSGKLLLNLTGHGGAVFGIAFSKDGKWLGDTSSDETAKIWDISTGKEMVTLTGHNNLVYGLSFSPDGTFIATGGNDGTVQFQFVRIADLVNLAHTRLKRTWTVDECQKFLHVDKCP